MSVNTRDEVLYAVWVDPREDVTLWRPIRELTHVEARQIRQSSAFVTSVTIGSAFEMLSQYQDDLHEAIDELAANVALKDPGTARSVERVRRRFADFLGAFSTFLERTRRLCRGDAPAPIDGPLCVKEWEVEEFGRNLA